MADRGVPDRAVAESVGVENPKGVAEFVGGDLDDCEHADVHIGCGGRTQKNLLPVTHMFILCG